MDILRINVSTESQDSKSRPGFVLSLELYCSLPPVKLQGCQIQRYLLQLGKITTESQKALKWAVFEPS